MDAFLNLMPIGWWLASAAVAFVAGFVKGIVGFAMPLVMVSGLGAFLSPELALAGLVFPAVVLNFQQAFRGGINPVRKTVRQFRWFLISCSLFLFIGAQFVPVFPARTYYLLVGIPVIAFVISSYWDGRRRVLHNRAILTLALAQLQEYLVAWVDFGGRLPLLI